MKLRIPFDRTINLLRGIPHNSIKDGVIDGHWTKHYVPPNDQNGKYGEMRAQAVCWLYCWAMTGMNSVEACTRSQTVFSEVFATQFEKYPRELNGDFHEWARKIRNRQSSSLYESDLRQRLGIEE